MMQAPAIESIECNGCCSESLKAIAASLRARGSVVAPRKVMVMGVSAFAAAETAGPRGQVAASGRRSPHRDAAAESVALRELLSAMSDGLDGHGLTEVRLNGIALDGSAARFLAVLLQRAPALRHLGLRYCGAGAEGLGIVINATLQAGSAASLESLDIAGSRLTSHSLSALGKLVAPLRNLRRLDLGNNLIGRRGAKKVVQVVASLPSLEALRLSHCEVADGLFLHLAASAHGAATARAELEQACRNAGHTGVTIRPGVDVVLGADDRSLLYRIDREAVLRAGGAEGRRIRGVEGAAAGSTGRSSDRILKFPATGAVSGLGGGSGFGSPAVTLSPTSTAPHSVGSMGLRPPTLPHGISVSGSAAASGGGGTGMGQGPSAFAHTPLSTHAGRTPASSAAVSSAGSGLAGGEGATAGRMLFGKETGSSADGSGGGGGGGGSDATVGRCRPRRLGGGAGPRMLDFSALDRPATPTAIAQTGEGFLDDCSTTSRAPVPAARLPGFSDSVLALLGSAFLACGEVPVETRPGLQAQPWAGRTRRAARAAIRTRRAAAAGSGGSIASPSPSSGGARGRSQAAMEGSDEEGGGGGASAGPETALSGAGSSSSSRSSSSAASASRQASGRPNEKGAMGASPVGSPDGRQPGVIWRYMRSPLQQLRFLDVSHSWIHGAALERSLGNWKQAGLREMWVTGAFWENDQMMRDVESRGRSVGIHVEL